MNQLLQKKIKQDTLTVTNDEMLRFEVSDLNEINLDDVERLGEWEVKCRRPLSDVNKNCSYGIIRGVNIEETKQDLLDNLRFDVRDEGKIGSCEIVDVERITRYVDGEEQPTENIKITFSFTTLLILISMLKENGKKLLI